MNEYQNGLGRYEDKYKYSAKIYGAHGFGTKYKSVLHLFTRFLNNIV